MERIPLIPLFLVESTYVLLRNQVIARSAGNLEESLLTVLRIFATLLLFWIYRKYISIKELRELPPKQLWRLPFFLAMVLLSGYAVLNTQGTGDDIAYSALLFLVTPFVGIHEELANRRILQERMRQHWGIIPTLIVSNLFFCLFHFGVYSLFQIRDYGEIFLVGLLLGILYERTRSLLLVAFLHTAYDWFWIFGPVFHLSMSWMIASLVLLVLAIPLLLRIPDLRAITKSTP